MKGQQKGDNSERNNNVKIRMIGRKIKLHRNPILVPIQIIPQQMER